VFRFQFVAAVAFTLTTIAASAQIIGNPELEEPRGELSLSQILALALDRNPDLAASASEIRALEGRLLQAGVRPNPALAGVVENLGGDLVETGGVQSTFSMEQRFELGGDRSARVAVARAGRDLAQWDLESRRRSVSARARLGFIDVLAAQQQLELSEASVRLADEVRSTVAARVEAGKVSPIEETRAEVALASERIERERAALELANARSRLAAVWGGTGARFERVVGDLDSNTEIPSLESLLDRIELNPEVARWATEIAEREAQLQLERARGVHDITVAGGYRRFEAGSNAFVATVELPIPLFDRNRGAQIEARERILGAQETQRAARVRIRQVVEETYASLARSESEIRILRERVIPYSESVYAAVSEGYRLGRFGLMEVLESRRILAAVRAQLLRAQSDLQRELANLDSLTAAAPKIATNGEKP